jgi:NAD(P)-dependent dehydrogenase (short-subunit alcohol dehydrogenase family)
MELTGKTVVISGASSGVGRAASLAFAREKANVVVAARNDDELQQIARRCRAAGGEALPVVTDVSDAESVRALAKAAREWKGTIDVWVNNAGVLAAGAFDATPVEVHRQVIATNLMGCLYGAHAAVACFKQQGHGILINNISVGGFVPVPYGAAYTTSKFGLRGFTKALREELAGWPRIFVCDLFPAFLNTPGILHAANYTGKVLKGAPPVYDPVKVANAMVRVARRPVPSTDIGAVSPLLIASFTLAPRTMTRIAGALIRTYLRQAGAAPVTSGNVLCTTGSNMAIYGRADERRITRRLNTIGSLALLTGGIAAVMALKSISSNKK